MQSSHSPFRLRHRTSRFVLASALSLLACALVPSVPANNIYNSSSDSVFDSGFELFYAGPQWLLNALPGSVSDRVAHARVARVPFDRDGDRSESIYRYSNDIGTLTSPFNIALFNNVIFFANSGGTGSPKVPRPTIADVATTYIYNRTTSNTAGTADQWSAGTNWSAVPVGASDTTLTFGNGASLTAGATIFTNNDLAGNFQLNILNFTYAGPPTGAQPGVTISGNPLQFVSDGATTPTLNLNASGTVKPVVTISNNIVLTNNLGVSGGSTGVLSGVVSGGGSLTKDGAGTLTLSNGSNSFTGGLIIKAGTVSVSAAGNLGSSANAVTLDGGTLQLTGVSTGSSRSIFVSSNGGTIESASGTNNVSSAITNGTGATSSTVLNKTGGNQLTLSGNNTGFTGQWNVSNSNLAIAATNSISSSNAVTLSSTGGLRVAGGSTFTIGSLNGSGTGTIQTNSAGSSTLVVTQSTNSTVANAINNGTGTLGLTKTGAGTLTLTNLNSYGGATTVNGGTLELKNSGGVALSGTSGVQINNGGTLLFSANNQLNQPGAPPITLGTIGGTGAAPKIDAGGTSQGGVNAGGTAGLGALTLNVSSTISLTGTSVLHFANSTAQTWQPGVALTITNWDGNPLGSGSEQLLFGNGGVTPGLNAGQLAQIQFVDPAGFAAGTYSAIFSATDLNEIVPGVAIPEPSTWIGAALALGAIGWTQRKRVARVFQRA